MRSSLKSQGAGTGLGNDEFVSLLMIVGDIVYADFLNSYAYVI